jgi:hypothetical protein
VVANILSRSDSCGASIELDKRLDLRSDNGGLANEDGGDATSEERTEGWREGEGIFLRVEDEEVSAGDMKTTLETLWRGQRGRMGGQSLAAAPKANWKCGRGARCTAKSSCPGSRQSASARLFSLFVSDIPYFFLPITYTRFSPQSGCGSRLASRAGIDTAVACSFRYLT